MPKQNKAVFRIQFQHHDQLIELYAGAVSQSSMMAFIEISELIFDQKTELLIDPAEEKIKAEFGDVKSTYIPIHSIVRIDEVIKAGSNKIRPLEKQAFASGRVSPFPGASEPKS